MIEERNIIERSLDVFDADQRRAGLSTDEVSFVGGFMTCFGILTNRVDIGMPPNTSVLKVLERIHKELDDYRRKVIIAENLRNGGT
ncbi:MAG TPA: hypothetical protein VGP94_13980 [Tepidisphaeraceae bacterium]|jgi:hypothetical protein|nr:hypothetical protein [Tepidisphaeraceae bacterium]